MPPSQAPHLHTAEAVAQAHGVNPDAGLHPDEALRRSATHGANELAAGQDRPWWHLLADQFKDFMVLVLLGAAVISGLVGEVTDTLVILVIVVLNAVIGFVQACVRVNGVLACHVYGIAQMRMGVFHGISFHTERPRRC